MAKICVLLLAVSGSLSAQWSTLPVDLAIPMNTSTPGTTLTTTIANAGIVSSDCAASTCTFTSVAAGDFTVGANQGTCANLGPVTLNGGSVSYAAGAMNYNSIGHNDLDHNTTASVRGPSGVTNVTVGWCMTLGPPPVTGLQDYDEMIIFATGGDYATAQVNACTFSPGYGIRLESGHPTLHSSTGTGTGTSGCIQLVPQQTYWFSMNYNIVTGVETLYAYTAQGTFVGSVTVNEEYQSGETFFEITFGNNEAGNDSGTTTYFQNIMLDWTNHANPLMWTGTTSGTSILAPSRSTAWVPGVRGGIPTTRTQCVTSNCQTVTTNGASSTSAQINAAIASAPANTYVLLPAGTYSNATGCILLATSNVTLRGAGANQTFLAPTSTSGCGGSIGMVSAGNSAGSPQNGPVAVTGNVTQNSTTLTLASVPHLVVGNPIMLDQLDPTCDNGGIFVSGTGSGYTCTATSPGLGGPYNTIGGGNGIRGGSGCSGGPGGCYHQQQMATLTQCDGVTTTGHACSSGSNVTISPGLHMPNWSTANMFAWWATSPLQAVGLENLNVSSANNSGANSVEVENCQGCWVTGVTSQQSSEAHVQMLYSNLATVRSNYFFATQNAAPVSYGVECFSCFDSLIENNIFQAVTTPTISNGPATANVWAYNFTLNDYYASGANYSIPARGDHAADSDMNLTEGNISNGITGDVIHGTANMETFFRNYYPVQAACYASGSSYSTATYGACTGGITTMQVYAFHRFYNIIGNVLGTSGTTTTYCNGTTSCSGGFTANNSNVLGIGYGNGGVPNDSNVVSTTMLWGNADPVTGYASPRFNCSEVPTALSASVQLNYKNPCPANDTLPASFYYSSTPPWWPSGKPWPIIGPDVTSGNIMQCTSGTYSRALVTSASQCSGGATTSPVSGRAYSNPAMDCYLNTMGGAPNGTGGVGSFNASTCYGGQTAPSCTVSSSAAGPYTAGEAVSQTFTESGCNSSTFTVSSGSLAGSGLTLNSASGVLSGTAAAGTFSFTVAYGTGSDPMVLTVDSAPSITTTILPSDATGSSYSQTLAVSGGKAPFTCTLTSGSLAGSGLTLNSNCTITGTAATAATYSFAVMPTDANGVSGGGQALSITVTVTPPNTPASFQAIVHE